MSKLIPGGSPVTTEVTSFATCWQVRLSDGTVFAFTDNDTSLQFRIDQDPDSITYTPVGGYKRGNITTSSRMDVDNVQLEGAIIDSLGITLADIRAGRFDFMSIKVFLVDWSDLTAAIVSGPGIRPIALRAGFGGRLTRVDQSYQAEIRGMMERLRLEHGQLFSPLCRVDLGSVECGINLLSHVKIANVDTIQSKREFTAAGPVRVIPVYDTDVDFNAGTFDATQIAASGIGAPAVLQLVRQTETENGTDKKPFLIETEADLIAMGNNRSASYALVNNIALTAAWDPIEEFYGTLDGRGHIISNLEISETVAFARCGLFGILRPAARIIRLAIQLGDAGIENTVDNAWKGTFAGENFGNIRYCYAEAPLVPTRGAVHSDVGRAGGFLGRNLGASSMVRQCWSNVPVDEWEPASQTDTNLFCGGVTTGHGDTANFVDVDIALSQSGPPVHTPAEVVDSCASELTTANALKEASYTGWDGTDVWDFNEDIDYPRLKIATGPLITDHA